MMENHLEQALEHQPNGLNAPFDMQKHRQLPDGDGPNQGTFGERQDDNQCKTEQISEEQRSSSENKEMLPRSESQNVSDDRNVQESYPSETNKGELEHKESDEPVAKKSRLKEVQNASNTTVEEFLTELVHAYPRLDLTCLTEKDIKTMLSHEMVLNKEKFGLVPLEEYNATRRPKPQPRPAAYAGNTGYHSNAKNSVMNQQNPYSNMQNYAAPTTSQSHVPQPAGHVGGIDPAVLSSWYSEMLRSGYPADQLQAYFSDMLMKMSQGQNPLLQQAQQLQQQQQQQQSAQQQQWAGANAASSYTPSTSANAAALASYATSTSPQIPQAHQQSSSSDVYSSNYNHKSASPYDARMSALNQATSAGLDSNTAYDASTVAAAQKLASMQQWRNDVATSAAAAAALYQGSTASAQQSAAGYPPQVAPVDMSAWQSGTTDMALQYGSAANQDDSQGSANQAHQGYM